MAETSVEHASLGEVDRSYHQYPFKLLFAKCYGDIQGYKLVLALTADLLRNRSDLVVIPGYHRVEYWAMLVCCILLRRKRAVFCDSTAHDREKNSWKERPKAFFFRRCDGIFSCGIKEQGICRELRCQGAKDIRRLPELQRFRSPTMPSAVRKVSLNRKPRDAKASTKFLYVGRLSSEKGLYDLLEAFGSVREQMPDARLDIVGPGVLANELKRRRREPWTGVRCDVSRYEKPGRHRTAAAGQRCDGATQSQGALGLNAGGQQALSMVIARWVVSNIRVMRAGIGS